MNNRISDLPKTVNIPQGTNKPVGDFHDRSVESPVMTNEVLRTQVSMNKNAAPEVEGTPLSTRTVERTESRHILTITDKNYKAILGDLCRHYPHGETICAASLKDLGIEAGKPLPDDFPKRVIKDTNLTAKDKYVILKRLQPELLEKWSTQRLRGELNAYQKQLDKEHGIDPTAVKDQKLKTYQDKLAKQEFDMKLLFLIVEYGNKSSECERRIKANMGAILNVFNTNYNEISQKSKDKETLQAFMQSIFSFSQEDSTLLVKVLEKATEIYTETQKTAQYTPIMAQRALVSAEKCNNLLSSLMKGDTTKVDYREILSSLGILNDKPLPDDLMSQLYKNKELTDDKKKIILKSFQDELFVKMSSDASIHKINVHDRTLATNPEAPPSKGFQTQLAKSHFQENLAALLMEEKVNFGEISLDQYERLRNCKDVQDTGQVLINAGIPIATANDIAGDVWNILQESKKIEDYSPPQLDEVKKAELKKVFTDPEILKVFAFLQTDQTSFDRAIIHYEGVKADPEVIEALMSSAEFSEFMTGFNDIIFTEEIKEKFEMQLEKLNYTNENDRKDAKKELKDLENEMIKNVSDHLKKIGDKLAINMPLDPKEVETAQKLTALLNVADGKKVATKDMVRIIKHRILYGIKLATLSLFAASALCVVVTGVITMFIPAISAITIGIIVVAITSAFGIIGFNVGAFGSKENRESYAKFMTHLKEMGTNMNVRQSEKMASSLFAGL